MGDSVTNMEKCCFHYVRYIIASKFKSKSGSDYILFFFYILWCVGSLIVLCLLLLPIRYVQICGFVFQWLRITMYQVYVSIIYNGKRVDFLSSSGFSHLSCTHHWPRLFVIMNCPISEWEGEWSRGERHI